MVFGEMDWVGCGIVFFGRFSAFFWGIFGAFLRAFSAMRSHFFEGVCSVLLELVAKFWLRIGLCG